MSESPVGRPKLEFSFRSFKLKAEDTEAIRAIRWPLAVVLVAISAVLIIVAWRSHPIDTVAALASYFQGVMRIASL